MNNDFYKNAYNAKFALAKLTTIEKNNILRAVAEELVSKEKEIIEVNKIDIINARKVGLSEALIDRLTLTSDRIASMASSLNTIADFKDPIGEVINGFKTEAGLLIERVRTPLGVIGIIYESRPNVTIDAAALCLKSSNVVILRGSSNAINSNKYLTKLFNRVGEKNGLPFASVNLIEDTDRIILNDFIRQDKYVDVLIPRGGKELKRFILDNSSIPVIVTGAGTCHAYVDSSASFNMATNIILNGKTQRPSTCNSLECILLHKEITPNYANVLVKKLLNKFVKVNVTDEIYEVLYDDMKSRVSLVGAEAFGSEYLSMEILITQVDDIFQAIKFINKYSTNHSEVIVTENLNNAEKFLSEVDSACVYVNASTRFSDGGEFGFGGEIGISTQKLHARGPMGISELTSIKFKIRGNGEVRG